MDGPEIMMLSEINETHKDKYYLFVFSYVDSRFQKDTKTFVNATTYPPSTITIKNDM
jgi:hypothetical protein